MTKKSVQRCLAASVGIAMLGLASCSSAPTAGGSDAAVEAKAYDYPAADTIMQYDSAQEIISSADISQFCGDKPVKLAYSTGSTVLWAKTAYQMMVNEVEKCDNDVTIDLIDAQNDPQKAVSDINAAVAQGYDGIITLPYWGESQLPAFRQSVRAGVPVATFISNPGGLLGQDTTIHVSQYDPSTGERWADWLKETIGEGKVVFLGNEPGQPSSQSFFAALKAGLEKYPELVLVEDEIQSTKNDTAEKFKVVSGLLSKHGRIDAIVSDFGATEIGTLQAYDAAGLERPAIATSGSTNELGCRWSEQSFPLFALEGSQTPGVVALRKLLGEINDVENTEPTSVKLVNFIDSENGMEPRCDSAFPADTDWSAGFTDEEFAELAK